MKRLLLAAVLPVLLTGGYYFRGFFFETATETRPSPSLYQYTLQSGNLDELSGFAQVAEAQMRRLPVLQHVSSDLQIKSPPAIVNVDRQKAAALGLTELPAATISFNLAPGVALGDAIAQIQDMERRLALPATITSSMAKSR
jgi:multidrug efflux pump subunit AcrB